MSRENPCNFSRNFVSYCVMLEKKNFPTNSQFLIEICEKSEEYKVITNFAKLDRALWAERCPEDRMLI